MNWESSGTVFSVTQTHIKKAPAQLRLCIGTYAVALLTEDQKPVESLSFNSIDNVIECIGGLRIILKEDAAVQQPRRSWRKRSEPQHDIFFATQQAAQIRQRLLQQLQRLRKQQTSHPATTPAAASAAAPVAAPAVAPAAAPAVVANLALRSGTLPASALLLEPQPEPEKPAAVSHSPEDLAEKQAAMARAMSQMHRAMHRQVSRSMVESTGHMCYEPIEMRLGSFQRGSNSPRAAQQRASPPLEGVPPPRPLALSTLRGATFGSPERQPATISNSSSNFQVGAAVLGDGTGWNLPSSQMLHKTHATHVSLNAMRCVRMSRSDDFGQVAAIRRVTFVHARDNVQNLMISEEVCVV